MSHGNKYFEEIIHGMGAGMTDGRILDKGSMESCS